MAKAKKTAKKQQHFLQKPAGYVFTGLALFALAYILGSLALDSGSLLQWALALLALLWGLYRLAQAAGLQLSN